MRPPTNAMEATELAYSISRVMPAELVPGFLSELTGFFGDPEYREPERDLMDVATESDVDSATAARVANMLLHRSFDTGYSLRACPVVGSHFCEDVLGTLIKSVAKAAKVTPQALVARIFE